MGRISKKVILEFPRHTWDQPVIYTLHSRHHLMFNILKAKITPKSEGVMILELSGEKEDFDRGIDFLKGLGVRVRYLAADINRDDEKCTHCGACTAICPTQALYIDKGTMEVIFDKEKCIGCEHCISVCPFRAIELRF